MNKELKKYIDIIKSNTDKLRHKYKVKSLAIFGSVVRGENTKDSDIDIIVEFTEEVGGFHLIVTEEFLTNILKRKVDLIPKKAIKGEFEKNIQKDLVII